LTNFDISNINTWAKASSKKEFSWKGTTFSNKESYKSSLNYNELEMMSYVSDLLTNIETKSSKDEMLKYGLHTVIGLLLDKLKDNVPPETACEELAKLVKGNDAFNILDTRTWDKASDNLLVWQGKPLKKGDGNQVSEKDMVSLLIPLIRFMGKGKELTPDYVNKIITGTLNKMPINGEPPPENTGPKGQFDPRKTTTYQYADYNKPLIIDGISIYRYKRDESGKFGKDPVDEGNFASFVEFRLQNVPAHLIINGYQTYLNEYIQWEADRCNENRREYVFGGYLFTDAMVELSAACTDKQKEKIGKIMCEYRSGGLRTHQLKQRLYYEYTGVDNYFFIDIVRAEDFQKEQDLMADYYNKYEFENETELYEYFNKSKYLEKYPRLKEYVVQNALERLKDFQEGSEKYVMIRKGKQIKVIEKGQEIPDGWTVSEK
jgi:hypothetical protein